MLEEPCGLVASAEEALKLVRRRSVGRTHHQIDSGEPFPPGEMREVHPRSRGDAKLVLAAAAEILPSRFEPENRGRIATRAPRSSRPAHTFEICATALVRPELGDEPSQQGIGGGGE